MASLAAGSPEAIALKLKDEGNEAFKLQNFTRARDLYSQSLVQLSSLKDGEQMSTVYCNRAAANLKLLDYAACITDCDQAIAITPGSVKALYRRAQANVALGELRKASADLTMLLRIDPNKADTISLMRTVKAGKHCDACCLNFSNIITVRLFSVPILCILCSKNSVAFHLSCLSSHYRESVLE
jgi:tetratricopeptide (TPR) repeat protein